MNKFVGSFISWSLNTIIVVVVVGFIYRVIEGVTSDDTVLNVLTWIFIITFGGIVLGLPFSNFSEWLKKKKLLNKTQAHWFSLIPFIPLIVGLFIGTILTIIGVLIYPFS